jgi:hypothetical protein
MAMASITGSKYCLQVAGWMMCYARSERLGGNAIIVDGGAGEIKYSVITKSQVDRIYYTANFRKCPCITSSFQHKVTAK